MPRAHIVKSVPIARTPRLRQVEGMFDLAPEKASTFTLDADLPLDAAEGEPWQIGLIVGPSGCGKTTLARELFKGAVLAGHVWPEDKSILDAFPSTMPIRDICGFLSSVGFSSPPAWMRPFHVLSNGEQFRVTVARRGRGARRDRRIYQRRRSHRGPDRLGGRREGRARSPRFAVCRGQLPLRHCRVARARLDV
jgi:hypothetical protein